MIKREKVNHRKTKAAATKSKIYECATLLFKEHGFYHVSVDDIVEMAGVSKGAFYLHFSSKYELVAVQIFDTVNKIDIGYREYIESLPDDTGAADKLIALAGKVSEVIEGDLGYDLIKIIYEAQITKALKTEAMLNYNRDLYKLSGDIISHGIRQGEFKPDTNVEKITHHFVMSMRGLTYEWCIRYPDFNLKNQILEHVGIIIGSMLTQ